MFLNGLSRRWHTRDGQQMAEGPFLVLMSPANPEGLQSLARGVPHRGLVRFVRMQQSGHFMVGRLVMKVAGKYHRIPLSGSYGADGLIRDVPVEVYAIGVDLPKELHEKWNNGGGHNSAGSEAPAMDEWAKSLKWPASSIDPMRRKKRPC